MSPTGSSTAWRCIDLIPTSPTGRSTAQWHIETKSTENHIWKSKKTSIDQRSFFIPRLMASGLVFLIFIVVIEDPAQVPAFPVVLWLLVILHTVHHARNQVHQGHSSAWHCFTWFWHCVQIWSTGYSSKCDEFAPNNCHSLHYLRNFKYLLATLMEIFRVLGARWHQMLISPVMIGLGEDQWKQGSRQSSKRKSWWVLRIITWVNLTDRSVLHQGDWDWDGEHSIVSHMHNLTHSHATANIA